MPRTWLARTGIAEATVGLVAFFAAIYVIDNTIMAVLFAAIVSTVVGLARIGFRNYGLQKELLFLDQNRVVIKNELLRFNRLLEEEKQQSQRLMNAQLLTDIKHSELERLFEELTQKTALHSLQIEAEKVNAEKYGTKFDAELQALSNARILDEKRLAELTDLVASSNNEPQQTEAATIIALQSGLATANQWISQVADNTQAKFAVIDEQLKLEATRVDGVAVLSNKMTADHAVLRRSILSIYNDQAIPHDFHTASIFSPEEALVALIAKRLITKTAVDVGANRGDFSAIFERESLSVSLFEPMPENLIWLGKRFAGKPSVQIYPYACSYFDGDSDIHVASVDHADDTLFSSLEKHPVFEGFNFTKTIPVQVRRLDSVLSKESDRQIGILKIDTEGQDLNVLKGASKLDAEVLLMEFWNKDFVFNKNETDNDIGSYLNYLNVDLYPFHVILWRGVDEEEFGFIAGGRETPKSSWGNVLFFRDKELLIEIEEWAKLKYGINHFRTCPL